jgi:hypothetical protein
MGKLRPNQEKFEGRRRIGGERLWLMITDSRERKPRFGAPTRGFRPRLLKRCGKEMAHANDERVIGDDCDDVGGGG